MKKIVSFIIALTLSSLCTATAFADSFTPVERTLPLVVDEAQLLSDSEETQLIEKLEAVGNKHKCEVAVVTVNSTGGKSHRAYADDFYDYNGYGYGSNDDGLLFLLDMGGREMYITTHGTGIKAITDYGRERLFDEVQGDIKSGDYYDAFTAYAEIVDDYYTRYENGAPYDSGSDTFAITGFNILGAVAGALAVGFIGTGSMKSKLKSVRSKPAASDYVKRDSLNITNSNDIFLYRNVRKVRVQSSSSSSGRSGGSRTHRSSSGRSHGGGGRRF